MSSIPHPDQLAFDFAEPRKICSKCRELLPVSRFHVKNKLTGQIHSACKACHYARCDANRRAHLERSNQYRRVYYARNPERERQASAVYREGHPGKYAELMRKYRASHPEYATTYRATHQEERRAYNARYRESHRDQRLAYNRAYYQEHRAERLEKYHTWRRTQPSHAAAVAKRSKAKHQDRVIFYNRAWRKRNLALCNTYWSKRRARIKANGGSHTVAEWEAILDRSGRRCLACGQVGIKLTVDHVLAINQGGTDNADNLQPLCQPCNASKGDRFIDYR